jgi:hypothetical protein
MINEDTLKYNLIRGLDIQYIDKNNQIINIKQPKIFDIDKIGLIQYLSLSYIFRIQKEHLKLYDEIKDEIQNKTIFESIIIQEKVFKEKKENNNMNNSLILLLLQSLIFFLDIDNYKKIKVKENYDIVINDFIEKDGNASEVPIFTLNNDNFDEFAELIRIITCTDILEIEKNTQIKKVHYDDPIMQKMYEEQIKLYLNDEEKKKKENSLTISDIIGSICVNENTKYNFNNIKDLTIWLLFYQFDSMFKKENIEITKSQFTSGNFSFDMIPDLNWLKKVKVTLPKDINITK